MKTKSKKQTVRFDKKKVVKSKRIDRLERQKRLQYKRAKTAHL